MSEVKDGQVRKWERGASGTFTVEKVDGALAFCRQGDGPRMALAVLDVERHSRELPASPEPPKPGAAGAPFDETFDATLSALKTAIPAAIAQVADGRLHNPLAVAMAIVSAGIDCAGVPAVSKTQFVFLVSSALARLDLPPAVKDAANALVVASTRAAATPMTGASGGQPS